MSIPDHVAHEPWPEVTGEVDRIAGLPAETRANSEDDEEEAQRGEVTGADIPVVLEGVDTEHE